MPKTFNIFYKNHFSKIYFKKKKKTRINIYIFKENMIRKIKIFNNILLTNVDAAFFCEPDFMTNTSILRLRKAIMCALLWHTRIN